jgi:hypothetical protein
LEAIRNKWRHGQVNFDIPDNGLLGTLDGLLPVSVILDEKVGPEIVLILRDPTDFVGRLKALTPFTLKMKAGVGRNDYGSLGFVLFWIEDPMNKSAPFAAYDLYINPTEEEQLKFWGRLGAQTHLHLFLIDAGGQQQGFWEFENCYGLTETINFLEEECSRVEMRDFLEAKRTFAEENSIRDLISPLASP